MEVDKIIRQPWVLGVVGGFLEGERVREKGVGEEWGKLGGLECGGGRKDG